MGALDGLVARLLPRLPDGLIASLAGAPIRLRDQTLDPRLALVSKQARKRTPLHQQSPAVARRATDEALAAAWGTPRPMASVEDRTVPGGDGPIPVRVFHPHDLAGPRPLVLYFHQGGCVIGNLDWTDTFCSILAEIARCPVLSVDYRLAPEHPFPASHDDAVAAYRWAAERAEEVGGDPARLVVAGDSAGGMLSVHVSQEMQRSGGRMPMCQLLIYPWLELNRQEDAYAEYADCYPLNGDGMAWFAGHLLCDPEQARDPRLSPGLAEDLTGTPPTVLATAHFDPLCDEGFAYAERLKDAGVPILHRHYASLPHSFTALSGVSLAARGALEEIAWDLERALTRPMSATDDDD
jgi:acetyl esterase/lipase